MAGPLRRPYLQLALWLSELLTRNTIFGGMPFPADDAARLAKLSHQFAVCRDRKWFLAAERVQDDLASEVRSAIDRMRRWLDTLSPPFAVPRQRASAREIYDDLVALEKEFSDLEHDSDQQTLAVTTDAIELEGVELGRFQIVLHYQRLRERGAYDIVALDPNPAADRPETTHPHVQDQRLCEGEGAQAIRRALEEGRLFEFFLTVRQILETYNDGSPHVRLDQWHGTTCGDCGDYASEEDVSSCGNCEQNLCFTCSSSCDACGAVRCVTCRDACADCGARFCENCLQACVACSSNHCDSCLVEGECQTCRALQEPSDGSHESAGATTEPLTAATGAPV